MAAHAYLATGPQEQTRACIDAFLTGPLGFPSSYDPDISWFTDAQFSVDDARALCDRAYRSPIGSHGTALVIAPQRLFHQAQNALLKLVEEPPAGVTLILAVPSAGQLLPTLRSRLTPLPNVEHTSSPERPLSDARAFLEASATTRERLVTRLLDATKADDEDRKQEGRARALAFAESLLLALNDRRAAYTPAAFRGAVADLNAFLPILHERAAPLKPIFEHLRLAIPSPNTESLTH